MIPSLRRLLAEARRRGRHAIHKTTPVPGARVAVLFFAAGTLWFVFLGPLRSSHSHTPTTGASASGKAGACDATRGEWVHDPGLRPYYTNATCAFIQGYQNCMKHDKPSLEFLQWKWRPDAGCGGLARFDAARFFRAVRGRSILFVGDSLASSHVLSLVCTLSELETPTKRQEGLFEHWRFEAHDFGVSFFWTPFMIRWRLTRGPETAAPGPARQGEVFAGPSDLHLDEPDERWMSAAKEHDHVVLSASHWFARPAVYYRGGRVVGCHGCAKDDDNNNSSNVAELSPEHAQRAAFRTVLRALARGEHGFEGTAVLRTVAPTHYDKGGWFDGGECPSTRPLGRNQTAELVGPEAGFYRAQVEEFGAAAAEAGWSGGGAVRLRLMDVTGIMLRRPDGHPGRYGHGPGEHDGFDVDCLHWCLPGPIDVWNELLLHILDG